MKGVEMMLSALGITPERIMEMAKELGVQQFLEKLEFIATDVALRLSRLEEQQTMQTTLLHQILESTDGQAAAAATNPNLPVLDKLPPMNGEDHAFG